MLRPRTMLVTLVSLYGLVFTCDARDFDAIKTSGYLRVAVDGRTPPFNYYRGSELTGFEVDLIKEIAKRLELKIEWTIMPFNTLLIGINQDRFDIIATSHTVTPLREKVVDFIQPHYCTGAYIISQNNGPTTTQDLKNKTVSVAIGTVYFDQLQTIPHIKKIHTVPNKTDGLTALLTGRADAWVTQKAIALAALDSIDPKPNLKIGDIILEQSNAMVIQKGNEKLRVNVNKKLEGILNDGTYDKLR